MLFVNLYKLEIQLAMSDDFKNVRLCFRSILLRFSPQDLFNTEIHSVHSFNFNYKTFFTKYFEISTSFVFSSLKRKYIYLACC